MQHILVTRGKPGSPSFIRSDKFGSQWVRNAFDGQTLRAIVPPLMNDIIGYRGNVGVTLSSFRGASSFINPDEACIPSDASVIVLAPTEPAADGDLADMRLWTTLYWSGPETPPSLGAKLRQKMVSAWLGEFFTPEQFEVWGRPAGGIRVEVWLRPQWNVKAMFPELFGITAKPPEIVTDNSPTVKKQRKTK